MAHLITHSLHQSWNYYISNESAARADFMNTLNKIRMPPSKAIELGNRLESEVRALSQSAKAATGVQNLPKFDRCVFEIAGLVTGGLWQSTAYKAVKIGSHECVLYGRMDVVRRNWILDIKYSGNYDTGKYFNSIQHPLYMFCAEIPNFQYIISDYESVWTENYQRSVETDKRLFIEVEDMIEAILSDAEMAAAFEKNWRAK